MNMTYLMMQVISSVAGMPRERNKQSHGSAVGSQSDSWVGQPPVVAVEDQADESEMHIALAEIHGKVCRLFGPTPAMFWMGSCDLSYEFRAFAVCLPSTL